MGNNRKHGLVILVRGRNDLEGLLSPTELEMFATTPTMEHTIHNHEAHRRFVPDALSQCFNQIKIDGLAVKDGMPEYIPDTHQNGAGAVKGGQDVAGEEQDSLVSNCDGKP